MPNPVFHENSKEGRRMKKRLTMKQKSIVKKLHSHGLPVKFCRRRKARSGVSVHDPFNDLSRKARVRKPSTVKRTPQAFDTVAQNKIRAKTVRRLHNKKGKVRKHSKFHGFWLP